MSAEIWKDREVASAFLSERSLLIPDRPRQLEVLLRVVRLSCPRPKPVPVAVEVRANSEPLTTFEHPENAVYVFGPEDGSIRKPWLHLCHRFVHIPANHCLNLATTVAVVLAHRRMSRQLAGQEPILPLHQQLKEQR